jgi:hypothetical protein
MQEAVEEYFDTVEGIPRVAGLAYFLGFEDRSALDYYQDKPEFSRTIKRAKLRIEDALERHLARAASVTGIIFNLKNNFGWKDAQEFQHTGAGGSMLTVKWVDADEPGD